MYNETYDEYIRSILGYPSNNLYSNGYQSYDDRNNAYQNLENTELDSYYPEIYKIVYPMIKTKCNNFRGNITNEELDNMTDEIYFALDSNESVEVRSSNTTNVSNAMKATGDKKTENRETRQINRSLRDLIRILLIRELLNRPGRPPMPGPGPRPPMRPPFGPGPRPPMRYDIFEY